MVRFLTWLAIIVTLGSCGGGDAVDQNSAQQQTPLAATTGDTEAKTAARVYQALNGIAPSYSAQQDYAAQAQVSPSAFAAGLAHNFASVSSKALALQVLTHVGVTVPTVNAASRSALLDSLEQFFSYYGVAARGQIILNLTSALAGLGADGSADSTFGAAADAFNAKVTANILYAANASNSTAQAISLPAASAGSAQNVAVGASVALDASQSASSLGGSLSYAWTLQSAPAGSTASLSGPLTSKPTFTADVAGNYTAALTVKDAFDQSATATVSVVAAAAASSNVTYSTPANFASVLTTSYQADSLTPVASLTNRSRYLISDAAVPSTAANYLAIGSSYGATTGYGVEPATIPSSSTNNTYLSKLIHVVSDASGNFRFDSHLHPNNAIDADAADAYKLKFRNNFGKASVTYGYVSFAYDPATRLVQARKRYLYTYNASTFAATYAEETSFGAANHFVSLAGGAYKLVATAAQATPFYIYESPLDFGIPFNMNPGSAAFVSNGAAAFLSKTTVAATEGTNGSIFKNVNATYQGQVMTPGSDAGTKAAADAMLAAIKLAVESSGEKLRYATSVYSTFRDGALATKLVSDAIADGTPGQNLVPYVYFTNEKDIDGKYHPFMIVVNYGNPASPNGLKEVPHPPGDGQGAGYGSQKVTRFTNLDNYVTRIPLKDYGIVSMVTENTLARTLLSDVGGSISTADVYNFASTADNGLLINGVVMFPVYNNTLVPSQSAGELSASGCHVGQGGGGPHCHADGFQNAKGPGVSLYSDDDYLNKTHPPLIGFGYDGVALFGTYRAGKDTSMRGYAAALDSFGGHDHDGIGYHYHAHSVPDYPVRNSSTKYTLNVLMKGAYIGKINSVPFFGQNTPFNVNKYLGGTVK